NWMWPRHTGDFSVFRIYADADNQPADYSPDNVPYRPRHWFPVSTAGMDEGDFTFVYGCPGSTREYVTSDHVARVMASNPNKIRMRTERLDIINAAMAADPAVRI
ncbi:MAG TPA: peptidase S46, partial [Alistipes sp.]|nr:peptidase S46 [Alistipes sp.]